MKRQPSFESDAVAVVEKTIEKLNYYPTKTQLRKAIPKKVTSGCFDLILKHLEDSGKILQTPNGKIIWTYNPKLVKKYLSKGYKHLVIR